MQQMIAFSAMRGSDVLFLNDFMGDLLLLLKKLLLL